MTTSTLGTAIVKCKVCGESKEVFGHGKCDRCYHREYYHQNKEAAKKSRRKYLSTETGKRKHAESSKRHRQTNRKEVNARKMINNRVARGTLKKRNVCETCYDSPTEFHHPDYDKPLEYIELCIKCHHYLHNPQLHDGQRV